MNESVDYDDRTGPETVKFSTSNSDLNVTINASQVEVFDYYPISPF